MLTRSRTPSPVPPPSSAAADAADVSAADVSARHESAASDPAHPQGVPTNSLQPNPNQTGPAVSPPPPADTRFDQILAALGSVANQVNALADTVRGHGQQLMALHEVPPPASAHVHPLFPVAGQSTVSRPYHANGQTLTAVLPDDYAAAAPFTSTPGRFPNAIGMTAPTFAAFPPPQLPPALRDAMPGFFGAPPAPRDAMQGLSSAQAAAARVKSTDEMSFTPPGPRHHGSPLDNPSAHVGSADRAPAAAALP